MGKRSKSNELQVLSYLKPQLKHPTIIKDSLRQLQRGYDGESQFYDMMQENLSEHCLPICDRPLKSDGSIFQIDYLFIINNTIYMYEIKNYTGDYYLQNDRWYIVRSKREIRNPLLQHERSRYLLKNLLQNFPKHFEVKSFIVFVNESFMLCQAPLNPSIIFPTQIIRHIQTLNRHVGLTSNTRSISIIFNHAFLILVNANASWIIFNEAARVTFNSNFTNEGNVEIFNITPIFTSSTM